MVYKKNTLEKRIRFCLNSIILVTKSLKSKSKTIVYDENLMKNRAEKSSKNDDKNGSDLIVFLVKSDNKIRKMSISCAGTSWEIFFQKVCGN